MDTNTKGSVDTLAFNTLIAAGLALFVVHGFGRFVFTPLIPIFLDDKLFNIEQSAQLASWNYIGYLIGALLALVAYRYRILKQCLVFGILSNVITTGLQAIPVNFEIFTLLRLYNGISNGLVFVLAPAIALEVLARANRISISSYLYLGVGIGILTSDLAVSLSYDGFYQHGRWLPIFLIALLPALWSAWHFYQIPNRYLVAAPKQTTSHLPGRLWTNQTTPLFLAYACAGIGYILPMTFLSAVEASWSLTLTPSAWFIAAIASIPAIFLWNTLGIQLGDKTALMINFGLQAAGVLIIALMNNSIIALWLCAILVGGTFIGTVSLTQRLARALQPHQGPKLSAALISLYGVFQLLGPVIAGALIARGNSLDSTFIIGGLALILGGLLMLFVPGKINR